MTKSLGALIRALRSIAQGERLLQNSAVEPVSIVQRVENELELAILRGDYEPGERINENAVAARLNISRAPVREACRLLERAGLVRIVPNLGAIVASLTLQEVINLFDIRAALGRQAGEEAAASMDEAHLRELRRMLEDMDSAAGDRDAYRYTGLNIAFHGCLYDATGNARLAQLDHSLGKELRVYRQHGLAHGGGLASSNQEHRQVITAIERGDAALAGQLLCQHIRNGRDRFLRAMSATGQLMLRPQDSL